jgi:YidC/Oxa1 family membrane protein insertase
MDRKSILVLLVSFVLIISWFELVKVFYPPVPLPGGTNRVAGATNQTGTNQITATSSAPAMAAASAPATANAAPHFVPAQGKEETLTLENRDVCYTFTSHGGGLKLVELKRFPETVGNSRAPSGKWATLNTKAPVPALALLGSDVLQDDQPFQLTKTATGVRAEKQLANGLRLVKEFTPGTNYLLTATVRVENRGTVPLRLGEQEWVIGTATPINARDTGDMMGLFLYDGANAQQIGQSWFANASFWGCMTGTSKPRTTYLSGEARVVWAAVQNQFFTMIAMPKDPAPQVVSRRVDLPAPAPQDFAADSKTVAKPFGYQTALVYPATTLGTGTNGQFIERQFTLYTGPKEYHTLARLGQSMANNVDLVMDFGGFFGFFSKALLLSMNGLYALGLSYGLAIIAITVILKVLFWPLTQASTRSMKRMQELQPQMKAIQDRFKDNPTKMNQKLMEFMKENKVSPLGGCLPMLLQMPVFIGFFYMIRSAIELRGARFLWAADLSQPDTIAHLAGFPVNPLPLLMGVTMFWQASLTPPSPGMDPTQQKIMKYMPLMFLFMLYSMSSGLTLYWTVQNLLSIAQMKLTKSGGPKSETKPAAPVAKQVTAPKKKK